MDAVAASLSAFAAAALTAAAWRLKLREAPGVAPLRAALAAGLIAVASPAPAEGALVGALVVAAFVALAAVDLRALLLPDALTLPLLGAGLAAGALGLGLAWEARAAGAAALGATFAALTLAHRRLRGTEGLGLGDAKLAAAAGAWVGPAEAATVVLIAAPAAIMALLAFGRRDRPIPFGPFLALGAWVAMTRCPCLAAGP